MTSQVKQTLIDVLTPLITNFQKVRATVTDEQVKTFMTVRKIDL